ncbi:hypothetical protein FJT64_005863 [Amphibalanus amphitrite]|uniref:Protein masquerade clip-domain domain-containing protein n=1 Tax=Amphibalanus amphitrite TaxID=1232801 RepID=A0A6A4VYN8_AMPAM|nr:hypothetical protein FJT64_005863 [Amphibalanus amphitrite]
MKTRAASAPARQTVDQQHRDCMIQGLHTTRAPQIQILLHRSDGRRQQTTWTPDTGAEVSVISQEAAKQMGINVKKLTPPSGSLFAADGRELPCLGTCQVALQLGSIKRTIAVSVVKKLHSSLLSWHDAVRLGILHKEFPQQIRSAISEEEETSRPAPAVCSLKTMPGKSKIPRRVVKRGSAPALEDAGKAQKLHPLKPTWDESKGVPSAEERRKHFSAMKEAFPRVFDVTSKLRKMSGGSMAIELTEDATPVAVSTARSVPFCWRDDIRRQLDELLESDVIEPVEHPTECCYHALAALIHCQTVLEDKPCPQPAMRCCLGAEQQRRNTPAAGTAHTANTEASAPSTPSPAVAEQQPPADRLTDGPAGAPQPQPYSAPGGTTICPGVCVARRIADYCDAALDLPGVCSSDQRCCVPADLFDGVDQAPEQFVILGKKPETASAESEPEPQQESTAVCLGTISGRCRRRASPAMNQPSPSPGFQLRSNITDQTCTVHRGVVTITDQYFPVTEEYIQAYTVLYRSTEE